MVVTFAECQFTGTSPSAKGFRKVSVISMSDISGYGCPFRLHNDHLIFSVKCGFILPVKYV